MLPISRLTLVTDAWHPQTNGVVTTLTHLVRYVQQQGIEVDIIEPGNYSTVPLPFYNEIPLVWRAPNIEQRLLTFQPDAIHIATEGPLGWRVRQIANKFEWPFSSGYHTKFPEYLHKRARWIPESLGYQLLKFFHRPAKKTFVPAQSIQQELTAKGFTNLTVISRGVNRDQFHPKQAIDLPFVRPIHLYVGRLATEKNINAFLDLPLSGSKVIVGKGPDQTMLQKTHPEAFFIGAKYGQELAAYYASADVLVFPSLTDTFGVVNLEAIACNTPVAAFPVTGPKDIIIEGVNGALDEDLTQAIQRARALKGRSIQNSIRHFTWENAGQQFLNNLYPIDPIGEPLMESEAP